MHGAVKRDHRFAGARRPGDTRRAGKAAFDDVPLRRMQEHRPFLPRVFERDLEFLYVLHHSEAPYRDARAGSPRAPAAG